MNQPRAIWPKTLIASSYMRHQWFYKPLVTLSALFCQLRLHSASAIVKRHWNAHILGQNTNSLPPPQREERPKLLWEVRLILAIPRDPSWSRPIVRHWPHWKWMWTWGLPSSSCFFCASSSWWLSCAALRLSWTLTAPSQPPPIRKSRSPERETCRTRITVCVCVCLMGSQTAWVYRRFKPTLIWCACNMLIFDSRTHN